MENKIYALMKRTNPHVPSSGPDLTIVALSTDKAFIQQIYDSHPEFHFKCGEALPTIIIEMQEFNNHHYDKWYLDIMKKK